MKKRKYLILLIFPIIIGCKSKTNLDSIISENKIIFIGEDHSVVNPRIFLIENLEQICEQGVKHICMEGFTLRNPQEEKYDYYCFFPWVSAGSKYEDVLLSQKILEINKNLSELAKIKIYNPEEELVEKEIEHLSYYEKLNVRDTETFKFINSLSKKVPKEEKILIFYGYEHGSKKRIKNWKPLGQRLHNARTDFVSINFDYCLQNKTESHIEKQNRFKRYDYLIKQNEKSTYGICYQFFGSKENTQVLINHLINYSTKENLFNMEYYDSLSDEREFLNNIYYLKMLYKDKFDYNFWDEEGNLLESLEKLKKEICSQKINFSNDINSLRNYHKWMIESGIEDFIQKNQKLNLKQTKNKLKKAFSYYQEDLWCLYWLASVEFELKEYENAIENFEKCLEYDTINCIEVLPYIYEKLILSTHKIQNLEKEKLYKNKLSDLSAIKIQMVRKMKDIR